MHLFDGRGERILTLSEAAEALDYDQDYVLRHAEDGTLPSFTVDDELMFSKSALEDWILSIKVTHGDKNNND